MKVKINYSISAIFLTISVLILMFQLNIAEFLPVINYYDEVLTITFAIWIFVRNRFKITTEDFYLFLFTIFYFLVGCIGNLRTGINNSPFLMIVDALGISKIFFALHATKVLFNKKVCDETVELLSNILQIYVFAAAICFVLAVFLNWNWMFKQARFGFMTYGFIHGYAGDGWLGYYLEAAYCIFLMRGNSLKLAKTTRCVCLALTVATIKGPALLFVAFVLLYDKIVKQKKLKTRHIILTIIIGIIVGWWYIQRYLLTPGEARSYLNLYGFKIALDYFPTGMGFATFGSDLSRDYYSAAYYQYGLNVVYGLGGSGSTSYITDTYWGMLLGQLGLVASVLFIFVYYRIFKSINSKQHVTSKTRNAVMAMFFSFMAGSIGSAYLTSHLGVICFMIIGLFLNSSWANDKPIKGGLL